MIHLLGYYKLNVQIYMYESSLHDKGSHKRQQTFYTTYTMESFWTTIAHGAQWAQDNSFLFLIYAFLLLIVILTVSSIITNSIHLRSIPGPWWARYTRLWLFNALYSERCAEKYMQINKKYGTCVLLIAIRRVLRR